jgi:hypothetical protein
VQLSPTVRNEVEKRMSVGLELVTARFLVRVQVEEQIQGLFPEKDPDIAIFWVFLFS